MLQALIQTLANLGFDSEAINNAFNAVIATVRSGDTKSLEGLGNIATGILSIFTGVSATDISSVIASLVTGVLDVLSSSGTSTVLSTITGA